jgi:hypothetical protein
MTKCIILGSGPNRDIEYFEKYEGIKIACDKEYRHLVERKIHVDYVITLEDGDLSHYFKTPTEPEHKPIVICSDRTPPSTLKAIDEGEFSMRMWRDELLHVIYSVGTMAWLYAWKKLGCKKIRMDGFDSLQQEGGYDLLHHLWRDAFWEMHDDYCPNDVETIIDNIRDSHIQKQKDSLSLDRVDSKYPGFSNMKDYIRYRRDRNDNFLLKLKVWDV